MSSKIVPVLAAIAALSAQPATAQAGVAEVFGGHEAVTLDVKVAGSLAPRTTLFARQRVAVDYHNQATPFSAAGLSYALAGTLEAVALTQFVGGRVVPRLGMQYAFGNDDASMFLLVSASLIERPDAEMVSLSRFRPLVADNLRLLFQLETVTNVGVSGYTFSVGRLRCGLDINGYAFGIGGDIVHTPIDSSYNLGAFVRREF